MIGPNRLMTVFFRQPTKRAWWSHAGQAMLLPGYPFFTATVSRSLQGHGTHVEHPVT